MSQWQLDKLHIISREHAVFPIRSNTSPPTLIQHFYLSNNVIGVKGDLSVIRCEEEEREKTQLN